MAVWRSGDEIPVAWTGAHWSACDDKHPERRVLGRRGEGPPLYSPLRWCGRTVPPLKGGGWPVTEMRLAHQEISFLWDFKSHISCACTVVDSAE
eukprot:2600303-Pyramimonas_sp.AAC.2